MPRFHAAGLALALTASGCAMNKSSPQEQKASSEKNPVEYGIQGNVVPGYAGFDPGMQTALAAAVLPGHPGYFEDCRASPNGKCFGTLESGSGFYTIASGEGQRPQSCRVNSGEIYRNNEFNPAVPCPFYFYWGSEENKLFARMETDSLAFPNIVTTNLGVSLQQNVPSRDNETGREIYAGLSFGNLVMTPWIRDIESVSFQYRAKVCPDRTEPNKYEIGRVHTYISFFSEELQKGGQFGINLIEHVVNNMGITQIPVVRTVASEDEIGGPPSMRDTIHINGLWAGFTTGQAFIVDSACTMSLNGQPWQNVTIPIDAIKAKAAHRIDENLLAKSRLVQVAVAGVEAWGRLRVSADVRGYAIKLRPGVDYSRQAPAPVAQPGADGGAGAPPAPCFDEAHYLRTYPTIAQAIQQGRIASGREHWDRWGRAEGRMGCPIPAPQAAPQAAPQVAPQPAPQPAPQVAPQPAPQPAPQVAPQPAPRLPEGYYLYNGSGAKFYSNGVNAACWFAGSTPHGEPLIPTDVTPASVGFPSNERCGFDVH